MTERFTFEPEEAKPWSDPEIFEYYEQLRSTFRPLTEKIVQDTLNHFPPESNGQIVEVGSGTGELARVVGPDIASRIIRVEKSSTFAEIDKQKNPNDKIVNADVYNLPLSDESADTALGFSMFDTLFDSKRAAEEICRILKRDGRFIHFLDMEPNIDVLFDDIQKQGKILFPLKAQPSALSFTNKDRLEDPAIYSRYATADKSEATRVIDEWVRSKKPFAETAMEYLENPHGTYMTWVQIDMLSLLENMTSELNRAGLKLPRLDIPNYFSKKMADTFSGAGFEVEMNGLKDAEMELLKSDSKVSEYQGVNSAKNRMGTMYGTVLPDLDEEHVRLRQEIHVFVAKKII